ncbi:MAG: class I SAM-dependent DNA methyltransferase [Defluviicoccus sp.]
MAEQARKHSFVAALKQLGGSAGNARLREALGWDERTYAAVRSRLINDGIVTPGRGRGGSVAFVGFEGVPDIPAKDLFTDLDLPPAEKEPKIKPARPNTTAANVGYEADLWRMADALRGSMDAAEYKHVVLGLIFLKYISDTFEEMHARLEAEKAQGADPEDPDEYRAQNIFWVPPEARWPHLKAQARQSTIGQLVDDAMAGIERDNPALKSVLPRDYARPALDKTRLGQLIDLISNIRVGDAEARAKDVLGRVYEYFLSQFASAEGKKGGEFYTPRCVVKVLVEMLEPYRGRVYDPCCGSSGMFVQSVEFIQAHASGNGNGGKAPKGAKKADISIYGQESNYTTWRLAKMNLAIRGIDGQIAHGDAFHNDRHPDLKADFILANPPFNISDWGGERLRGDKRWVYGDPPAGNANFAWVQHIVHHLSPTGTAGFVLSNGSMSSNQSGEGEIRKKLVEADLVDCMIALPGQLFYSTQIPACLWFLARDRKNHRFRDRRGEVLFIDARKMGVMVDRTHRELSDEDIAKIAGTYHLWRGETGVPPQAVDGRTAYEDIPGFCKAATLEEIAKHGHVLTPGRYVGAEAAEQDGEPFAEKMARLVADLRAQQTEAARLDAAIAANLRELGFGGTADE